MKLNKNSNRSKLRSIFNLNRKWIMLQQAAEYCTQLRNKKAADSSVVKLIIIILLGILVFIAVIMGLKKKFGLFGP